MKVLIVFSHPNPNSFNGAVLKVVNETLKSNNHEIKVKDLYRTNWDPRLTVGDLEKLYSGTVPEDIKKEQETVEWADMVVFIYPIWWFEQPAMLKGWIDRVFSHGFAYRQTDQGMVEGLLKGKKAVVITTSGANEENMRQNGILDAIMTCMVNGTLGFCGFQDIVYKNLYSVPSVSDSERQEMLEEVKNMFAGIEGRFRQETAAVRG